MLATVTITLGGACDRGEGEGKGKEAPGPGPAQVAAGEAEAAKAAGSEEAQDKPKREKKDRGESSMTIGGVEWLGSSARATTNGTKLVIKTSRNELGGPTVKRQELQLEISDYAGPGDYEAARSSRFTAVGLNTAAAQASDEAANKEVLNAISDAANTSLGGAKVHIDSDDGKVITGTFSWTPPVKEQPEISGGTFRAIVPPPK